MRFFPHKKIRLAIIDLDIEIEQTTAAVCTTPGGGVYIWGFNDPQKAIESTESLQIKTQGHTDELCHHQIEAVLRIIVNGNYVTDWLTLDQLERKPHAMP